MVQSAVDLYWQILSFPVDNPAFVPSLIPIFVGLTVMELYFGRYKDEHLGWNSAVSNATLLITTALTLLYETGVMATHINPQYVVAYGILVIGTGILVLNFYHLWPAELAFNLSSSFAAYTTAYIAIAIVYGHIPVNGWTLVAATAVMATFYLLFATLQHVEDTAVSHR